MYAIFDLCTSSFNLAFSSSADCNLCNCNLCSSCSCRFRAAISPETVVDKRDELLLVFWRLAGGPAGGAVTVPVTVSELNSVLFLDS